MAVSSQKYYEANKERCAASAKRWSAANKDRQKAVAAKWLEANKEQHEAATKRWRQANKERCNENAKRWARANPAKIQERDRKRAAADPEKQRARHRKWRAANADKVRANKKAWEAANPEKHKAEHKARNAKYFATKPDVIRGRRVTSTKKWGDANPEKRALYHSRGHVRRKARLKNAGTFTLVEWKQLLDDSGHKCVCCGIAEADAIYRYPKRGVPLTGQLTRDHIVPLCKGGDNRISNIQAVCLPCNMRKHQQPIDYRRNESSTGNRARRDPG